MTAAAVKALRANLREAVESEATVTVVLENGRTFTGTVMEHPTLADGYYFVVPATASRERPAAFHKLDVAEVIFE
ncbi:hypothetical protein [Arthrobacter sp. EPSL27]|uniref:hypothetical protein n=1 Tax=Arthrobacter sp. EPSL27 TaxID=1745378 RepID=UPI000749DB6F|nr:hypothetical protein [Arthrobacter sp. EPSL27]KUM37691.1 hypothetical protein AR539_10765 [Arthrobacter sp. EPSL27]